MSYVIQENYMDAAYIPKGSARDFIYNHSPEVILGGPAETGKTLACCWKAHLICCKYPGAQGALIRKTGTDIAGTVFLTMRRVILGAPVDIYGGANHPKKLIYSNGSVIWIGGMDNPGKVLSGERDFIQVCQAEELRVEDWELMTTRVTGRGAIIPHPQIFGDCNPAGSKHFILERVKAGSLTLMRSIHRDNPTLFDDRGVLTAQGKKTMARLEALTGVRRKRLLEGIWASAEGGVFDMFDPDIHVRVQKQENYRNFRLVMDEGYTNPATILVIAWDNDKRRHIFREYYERGKLQRDVVQKALEWAKEFGTKRVIVDAAAAGLIADLNDVGLHAEGAKGRVLDRIHMIQDDLKVAGDGKPRLTVDPSCINTINEFESMEWKPNKDQPKKENDHAIDPIGYDYTANDQAPGGFSTGYKKG
jgi:phage terminase large subunit